MSDEVKDGKGEKDEQGKAPGFVPTDTVLQVDKGYIDARPLFKRVDALIQKKIQEAKNG